MTTAPEVKAWFLRDVLPLEAALMRFLRKSYRNHSELTDLRQDIYAELLKAARERIPDPTPPFVFTVARNQLVDRIRRERVIPIDSALEAGIRLPYVVGHCRHMMRWEEVGSLSRRRADPLREARLILRLHHLPTPKRSFGFAQGKLAARSRRWEIGRATDSVIAISYAVTSRPGIGSPSGSAAIRRLFTLDNNTGRLGCFPLPSSLGRLG
jgi:DNA-directed RNA polymerase specialized sigma24 family protein